MTSAPTALREVQWVGRCSRDDRKRGGNGYELANSVACAIQANRCLSKPRLRCRGRSIACPSSGGFRQDGSKGGRISGHTKGRSGVQQLLSLPGAELLHARRRRDKPEGPGVNSASKRPAERGRSPANPYTKRRGTPAVTASPCPFAPQFEGAFETIYRATLTTAFQPDKPTVSQKKLTAHNFRLICVNTGLFERVHTFRA